MTGAMQFIDLKTQHQRLKTEIDAGIAAVLERRAFMQAPQVRELGLPSSVYWPRPMRLQLAQVAHGGGEGSLQGAETLSQQVLSLPMPPYLTEAEVDQTCDAVLSSLS